MLGSASGTEHSGHLLGAIISSPGDLRLQPDLGTGSAKFGFLGVEWVVSETKPLRPS